MTDIDMDAVIAELRKGWIKGKAYSDEGACLMGACRRVNFWWSMHEVRSVVLDQFGDRTGYDDDLDPIAEFNDHGDTTLDDVILVLEKARAAQGEVRHD